MSVGESGTEQIGRRLEEISVDLVSNSNAPADPDRWVESLQALARFAEHVNDREFASIAEGIAQDLRVASDSMSDDELRGEFIKGIEQLQAQLGAGSVSDANAFAELAEDPELIRDFVSESREHLESIEAQVLTLEKDGASSEAIHTVFRSFHTIKGLAGFLGFEILKNLAHEVETVLDLARNAKLTITPTVIDVVLESKDYIAKWLRYLDQPDRRDPATAPGADQSLLVRIRRLIEAPDQTTAAPASLPEPLSDLSNLDVSSEKVATRSVKVDTSKLDYLVDMVGEMVIAQSLVRHDPDLKVEGNGRLARNLSQLARITDEVQRTAMAMRMVPVGPLFQKMARLVRDLSRKFGKNSRIETEGEDVELDRNIVEELADPLMHMIRNSLDHGIEDPAQRAATKKDPVALVRLRAFHRSGHIVIEVSDDGRGINKRRVLEKAQKNGLIAPNAQLTDAECFNLIFQPGFSTAEKVSDVSGRGVGMDVVRKQIQKLRGSVDLTSVEGSGTVFSLKLPLTLAIIDGLVVGVGSERYILPLASVKELFRPLAGQVTTVEGRAEVVSVRDKLVPVRRLYERFSIDPRTKSPEEAVFVMAEIDGASFCLMVDELIGKQEVVIKSLGSAFRNVSGIAGGAILGDGRVGLIIDLQTLFGGSHDA